MEDRTREFIRKLRHESKVLQGKILRDVAKTLIDAEWSNYDHHEFRKIVLAYAHGWQEVADLIDPPDPVMEQAVQNLKEAFEEREDVACYGCGVALGPDAGETYCETCLVKARPAVF